MNHTLNIGYSWAAGIVLGILLPVVAGGQSVGNPSTNLGTPAFEGLSQLENYLVNNADDHQARRQYADQLYEAGRFKEAAVHYEIFLQHFQGAPDTVHRYLISIAGYSGDNTRGERAAERYLNVYPTDYELHTRLGYFRLWQGKYRTAQEAFEQALRLNPDHVPAREGVIEAQAGIGLLDRLENPPPASVSDPSEYPQLDERRYRFIYDLMNYKRYFAAYEQLMLLAERHDQTNRWLSLYAEIDRALIESTGSSPAYRVDRYAYLLATQPGNRAIREALVDALMDSDRLEEAYSVLLDPEHIDVNDSGFAARLQALDQRRSNWIGQRIRELEKDLIEVPGDEARMAQLIAFYQITARPEDAIRRYEAWLILRPGAAEIRAQYARLLLDVGRIDDARVVIEELLDEDPSNISNVRLYTRVVLAKGGDAERAMTLLQAHLSNHPNDVDALLDLSEIHLSMNDADRADVLLRRAFSRGEPSDRERLLHLDRQVERAFHRRKEENRHHTLEAARLATKEENYEAALNLYEAYFELEGVRTRPVLEELARVYSLSGDYAQAVSIYEALQAYGYSPDVAREIARNRYLLLDHAGAIRELEALIAKNPGDMEARELLQQIYLEVQRYAQADSTYNSRVAGLADNTTLETSFSERLNERINLIERAIDTDYVGLVVPVSQYTHAKGSITSYEHWAQGLMTQVTLPAQPRPFMITAGLVSHFLNGTRRLFAGSPVAVARINQVMAGAYFDLTPPVRHQRAGYTNRIWMQFGVFDYSGTRTTGFADIRYLKHLPEKYTASVGFRTTEGALNLWTPAGGEFGLRLNQFDARFRAVSILPDSLLRGRAEFTLNLVSGNSDSTLARRGHNTGTNVRLESSIRILANTYLGLAFNQIDYRYTLDTYFSPKKYRAYDIWVEYENEIIERWFLRVRATTGLVSYRRGALAARIESDLIYRFSPHLAISFSGSAGYSVRVLDNQQALRDNRFRTFLFTGALYWTL